VLIDVKLGIGTEQAFLVGVTWENPNKVHSLEIYFEALQNIRAVSVARVLYD
jgi:hypothetical protein